MPNLCLPKASAWLREPTYRKGLARLFDCIAIETRRSSAVSLRVVQRIQGGKTYLQIRGTIHYPDGRKERIRQAPQSNDRRLADQEAAVLERDKLYTAWHGERRGAKPFAEVIESYLQADTRSEGTWHNLLRVLKALGDVSCGAVNQDAINAVIPVVQEMAQPKFRDKKPWSNASINRAVIMPVRAVLNYGAQQGWCDSPKLRLRVEGKGRTNYLLPSQARRLLVAASPHFRRISLFVLGCGARQSELLELEWPDVDLVGGKAKFWKTKNGRRDAAPDRIAELPPGVVEMLREMQRERFGGADAAGRVFPWMTRPSLLHGSKAKAVDYVDRERKGGSVFKTAMKGAIRRAGLNPEMTFHDLRHTWASWHYAIHKDVLKLQIEGRWSSIDMVTRYAHLMPAGLEQEIRAIWGVRHTDATRPQREVASAS